MKKSNPLVSIIIPTKNSAQFLSACLSSLKEQTYKNIEVIVVDNDSIDGTLLIAKKYTKSVFSKRPERSAQRNFGAKKAKGKYIFFSDSDMESSSKVIAECVSKMESNPAMKALVVPEESFGEGFWAACKHLERSFYIGVRFMEAARFFDKKAFLEVKGYDENLVSGEDWYLSQKLEKIGIIGRVTAKIFHNEGKLTYITSISKKYYYAKYFARYINLKDNQHLKNQVSIMRRYQLFFSQSKKLFQNPILGLGMLFLKTSEFAAGGVGYILSIL